MQTHLRSLKLSKEEELDFLLLLIGAIFIEKSEASKKSSPQLKSDLQTKSELLIWKELILISAFLCFSKLKY